jgi:hypothetical protein
MANEYVAMATQIGVYTLACLVAHQPGNWMIRRIIKRRKPGASNDEATSDRMGALIGTLERILTILLIGSGAFTAVGFIAAMKSVARYDKIQKEQAFAEYFLAGTMLSILLALVLALLARATTALLVK